MFRFDLLADIFLHANKIRQLIAFIEHRGDRQFVPEVRAILAIVAQPLADRLTAGDRFADQLQRVLIAIACLQKAAILVQDFVTAITGEGFESAVRVNQNGVITFPLGDHDAVLGCVDHALQQACVDH